MQNYISLSCTACYFDIFTYCIIICLSLWWYLSSYYHVISYYLIILQWYCLYSSYCGLDSWDIFILRDNGLSEIWIQALCWDFPVVQWLRLHAFNTEATGLIPGLGITLVAQLVKNPSAIQETWVRLLGWEDPLEKGTATHSSILAWRIPRGLQRVGHDRVTFMLTFWELRSHMLRCAANQNKQKQKTKKQGIMYFCLLNLEPCSCKERLHISLKVTKLIKCGDWLWKYVWQTLQGHVLSGPWGCLKQV